MSKNKSKVKSLLAQASQKSKVNVLKEIITPFIVSFITVFLVISFLPTYKKQSQKKEIIKVLEEKSAPKEKIKELIELEKYLYIDPLAVLTIIDSHNEKIIVIDVRDSLSYKKAHIKGAVNYSIDQIKKDISKFKKKKIVVYGNTSSSVLSKEAALLLIENNIDARLMSVGWNEFRHFRNLWLPESDWDKIDVNKYIITNE